MCISMLRIDFSLNCKKRKENILDFDKLQGCQIGGFFGNVFNTRHKAFSLECSSFSLSLFKTLKF